MCRVQVEEDIVVSVAVFQPTSNYRFPFPSLSLRVNLSHFNFSTTVLLKLLEDYSLKLQSLVDMFGVDHESGQTAFPSQ